MIDDAAGTKLAMHHTGFTWLILEAIFFLHVFFSLD
jgi:hypothetical protein